MLGSDSDYDRLGDEEEGPTRGAWRDLTGYLPQVKQPACLQQTTANLMGQGKGAASADRSGCIG